MPNFVMGLGLVVAYMLGSIPTGYWLARALKDIDIRQHGSGNIGASNVGRVLGKRWGIFVLILDIGKGTLAVLLGQVVFFSQQGLIPLDIFKILCAAAAVAGHNWTVFLGFHGGKGVATSAGALLGLSPLLVLLSAVVWGITAKVFGYIALASIMGAVAFCALTFVFNASLAMRCFALILAVILIAKHRGNIQRMLQGIEPKIGQGNVSGEGNALL